MIALLSFPPPPSPRAIQARKIFSRRSRRAENCRNGSTLERDVVTACLPASPRSSAAARAAARTKSGRSEERRVGKECRARGARGHEKKSRTKDREGRRQSNHYK